MTAAATHAGRDLAHVPARRSAPGLAANVLAARVVAGLPSSGRPLDPGPRSAMERGFGRSFGDVRVHADSYAAATAGRFRARALTVGTDILFGAGPPRTETPQSRELLAHELAHTAEQHAAGSVTVQLDAIADVEKLLSYGLLDWAITDAEAMEALAILEAIPDADLGKQLARLDQKYVSRLLDNLPDAAKTGPGYTRIIQALGPARTIPYAADQLSYGPFDLVITDAEVTRVFSTFANLPEADREPFLCNLKKARRLGRLVSNSNSGHHRLYIQPWIRTLTRGALTDRQRELLHEIVSESDDLATLTLAAETRFNVTVGETRQNLPKAGWDAAHLRATYLALDLLPEADVAHNAELLRLAEFDQPSEASHAGPIMTKGSYSGAEFAVNKRVSPDELRPTVLHETGHAVEKELNWEPFRPERGGWTSYEGTRKLCALDMIQDADGGLGKQLDVAQRADVVTEMAKAMDRETATGAAGAAERLKTTVRGLAWFPALTAGKRTDVLADRSFTAMEAGLDEPWWKDDGGEHLGTHVYQKTGYGRGGNDWARYEHKARARRVSKYQFRSPGEWFAEAFAWYYEPDPRGQGMKLADHDPDTKHYFDVSVNRLRWTR